VTSWNNALLLKNGHNGPDGAKTYLRQMGLFFVATLLVITPGSGVCGCTSWLLRVFG
jgi:hypothetical protein